MKKKIFIPTYSGGHVKIVIPVARELIKRGYEVVILALTSSCIYLKEEGLEYKLISSYIDIFEDKETIIKLGEEVIESNYNISSGLNKTDIQIYLGLNLYELYLELGTFDLAISEFKKNGKNIFCPINIMEKILKYEKPDIIMLTCGQRVEKATGIVANRLDIPVVRVIDLLGENDYIPYKAKLCVMMELVKFNILKNNIHLESKDIFITGQPNIEIYPNEQDVEYLKKKINYANCDNVILFLSQDTLIGRLEVAKEMNLLARNNNNNIYIYRLHPSESYEFYEDILISKSENLIFEKKCNLEALLSLADVVITFFSTAGLQAKFLNKPLITVNLTKKDYIMDFSKYGLSEEIRDIRELESKIQNIILNRVKVKNNKYVIPNNAKTNIVEVIECIIDWEGKL